MNKVLITGGAGFIGTNATAHFIEKGWYVYILDNMSRELVEENVKWLEKEYSGKFKLIKADVVTDIDKLNEVVNEVDLVIHLAGQVAVTTSIDEPIDDMKTNVIGTLNVLESIRNSKNKPALIFSSTNKVYGNLESLELEEKDTRYELVGLKGVNEKVNLDFHSPYGCSKGAADQYVHDYSRIYGLRTVVLRQSCIYGPHQFGVEDQGWVAWFTIATLMGKKLTIYGDGKQVRDILFIEDLVNCYDQLFENIEKISGSVFNIGGGYDNSVSLLEFLKILEKAIDKKIEYDFSDWRPGDQKIFISDNSLLKEKIGWEPTTNKEKGIQILSDWLKDNIDKIKNK